MTFLLKQKRGSLPVTAETIRATWAEKRRVTGTVDLGGQPFGQFVEHAGWDRTRVKIRADKQTAREANGRSMAGHKYAGPVPFTAAGIKAVLRRLRPEEAAHLAEIDRQIAHLQDQIAVLRQERQEAVREAWDRGHVVRVNELDPVEGY